MGWETFIPLVIIASASGVLAPGPLFLAAVSQGLRHGASSGLWVSLGHMVFEAPLVLTMALGISAILGEGIVVSVVGITGSAALIAFGALQLIEALRVPRSPRDPRRRARSPFVAGLLFTGLNPYFIGWWLTIGSRLVIEALLLASLLGVLIMYLAHIWMDYAWLILMAHLAGRARRLMGRRPFRATLSILGVLLILIGIELLRGTLTASPLIS